MQHVVQGLAGGGLEAGALGVGGGDQQALGDLVEGDLQQIGGLPFVKQVQGIGTKFLPEI